MGSAASAAVRPDGSSSSRAKKSGGVLKKFRSRRKEREHDSDSSSDASEDEDDYDDEIEEEKSVVKKRAKKQRPKKILKAISDPALIPSNWEEHMCDIHQCLYYFNTATGESTWEQPACFGAPDVANSPAASQFTSPPKSANSRLLSSPPPSAPPLSSRKKSASKLKTAQHGVQEHKERGRTEDTKVAGESDDQSIEYVFTLVPWAYQEPILSTAIDAIRVLPKEKLNHQDQEGNTLLALASQHRIKAIVKVLVDLGADVNVTNYGGSTALAQVCATQDTTNREIATMLIQAGASNTIDNDGCTPLHWAASCGDETVCTALLRYAGADPKLTDSYGFNPIQYAKEAGHEKLSYDLEIFARSKQIPIPEEGIIPYVDPSLPSEDLTGAPYEEQVAWVVKESASLSARSQQESVDEKLPDVSPPNAHAGPETTSPDGSESQGDVQTLKEQLIAKDKRIVESEMRLKTALSLCNKLLSVNRDLLPQNQNQMPGSKLPPLEKKGPKKSRPIVKKLHFDKIKSPPQFKDPATAMGLPSL